MLVMPGPVVAWSTLRLSESTVAVEPAKTETQAENSDVVAGWPPSYRVAVAVRLVAPPNAASGMTSLGAIGPPVGL